MTHSDKKHILNIIKTTVLSTPNGNIMFPESKCAVIHFEHNGQKYSAISFGNGIGIYRLGGVPKRIGYVFDDGHLFEDDEENKELPSLIYSVEMSMSIHGIKVVDKNTNNDN